MNVLFVIAGLAIVLVTAADIFQTVVVPRPTGRRFRASVAIGRRAWHTWRFVGDRLDHGMRERWLGSYASLLLVGFIAFWVVSLIVGYGLLFYALRDGVSPVPGFFEALYLSGTTALTVGYGDYVPRSAAARIVTLFAGASGLAGIAVVTSFLFPIFGAYQSREIFVSLVGNRAGRPPSPVELLELRARATSGETFPTLLRDAELWFARLLETHLAYPILLWFRSADEAISWLAVAETLLDATALLLTTVDEVASEEAVLLHRMGARFVGELSHFLHLRENDTQLDVANFDRAYDRLAALDVPMREREAARASFDALRSRYAGSLETISEYWRIPRARRLSELDDVETEQS